MVTDKIKVDGWGIGRDEALEITDRFAEYENVDHKTFMRLHLLAEETLGMVTAIAEDFDALFWLESTSDGKAYIHLLAETDMDYIKKKALIDASKRKQNDAAMGVMGKIREIVENSLYTMDEVESLQTEYGGSPLMYSSLGAVDSSSLASSDYQWSLSMYKDNVEDAKNTNPAAQMAWDELEKSIVANIADDVRVSVKGSTVELTIEKKIK
ncbi:MAG: hypothetical protein K6G12_09240 [Lachnospiraceae bacterium]|nr:hypothetical protein [Lachnospiraceae bacterium]